MSQDALSGPDLTGAVADANAAGLKHVVIGGFSVIFHGYVRATKDSDLLVPDGPESDAAVLRFLKRIDARRFREDRELDESDVTGAEHLRVSSRHGIIDILRGGLPLRSGQRRRSGTARQFAWPRFPASSASSASRPARRTRWTSPSSRQSTASCRSIRSPASTAELPRQTTKIAARAGPAWQSHHPPR